MTLSSIAQQLAAANRHNNVRRCEITTGRRARLGFTEATLDRIYDAINNEPASHRTLAHRSGFAVDTVRKVCKLLCRDKKIKNVGGNGNGAAQGYRWVRAAMPCTLCGSIEHATADCPMRGTEGAA